jgi:acetaldehyde dehydrogenase (acetylating)
VDADLESVQEARDLVRAARGAAAAMAAFDQERVDEVVAAAARAAEAAAEPLARAAVDETGFGVLAHKVQKNLFAARDVHRSIRTLKTCGIINRDEIRGVWEVAHPVGVVAAIVPSTNPTSTVVYNALVALKARNAVVFSPHPAAVRCSREAARVLAAAAESAGAPPGIVGCLSRPTLAAARELMGHADVDLILATGGAAMVRAAYSSGKPAYGVGPGNVPAYIDRSADAARAVACIVASKSFDNGVICASEQAVVCDAPVREAVRREFVSAGCWFLSPAEKDAVAAVLDDHGRLNPKVVGQPAARIAEMAGIRVPPKTPVLIGDEDRVGRDVPFSWEKISPVLAWYDVADWREGCARSIQILENGGLGHTLALHAADPEVIREFGLRKPVSRVVVNTPSSQGAIGLTTGLAPALTLGTGTMGGNITSDNITPLHLIHVSRVAFDRGAPAVKTDERSGALDEETLTRVVAEVLRELGNG